MRHITAMLLLSLLCTCDRAQKTVVEEPPPRTAVAQPDELERGGHDSLLQDGLPDGAQDQKTIGILVYDGVNLLDVFGPRYVLGMDMYSSVRLIAAEPGNVTSVIGVTIVPDATIDEVDQLDILVVPGGARGTLLTAYDDRVLDWIRRIDETSTYTASVCTGGWILGEAGLLAGKTVSANWYRADEIMAGYGAIFAGERYRRDGKLWTSAGVTAGMDMSLALLADLRGQAYAQAVMLDMEYNPSPPFPGGRVDNTPPAIYDMLLDMYDTALQPLMDSLKTERDHK